jgi:DNA-binding NtrC family response regulator
MNGIVSVINNCFRKETKTDIRCQSTLDEVARMTAPLGVAVLLGSTCDDDRHAVRTYLAGTRWTLVQAGSWPEMLSIPSSVVCPVIVCDLSLPGPDWQAGIHSLVGHFSRPSVVAVSNLPGAHVWDEFIRQGGFDVLPRPLNAATVLSTLDFAYIHWKGAWTTRQAGPSKATAS